MTDDRVHLNFELLLVPFPIVIVVNLLVGFLIEFGWEWAWAFWCCLCRSGLNRWWWSQYHVNWRLTVRWFFTSGVRSSPSPLLFPLSTSSSHHARYLLVAQRVRWQWCPLPLPLAFSPFLPISLILIQLRDIKIHARIQFTFTLEKTLLSRSRSLLITVIITVIIIICHRYSYCPTPALIQLNCIMGFYTYALWKTIVSSIS